ncbi:MAG: SAM-dependent methyltransferase [Chromatiaceae bacterium]|nr:SAM-dependent methyltransferase [Chromatiaceae bacterium]MCP5408196.1 SAM-dependent methyltransferase [Chromatiaceae bacterium]MCP5442007.1 SAM-dependent methyltransferase [Chromatiaceae bacterium]
MSTDPWPPNGHQDQLSRLPVPDDALLRQSKSLVELIVERINQSGGRLPFDRYMELALYAPGLGYYSAGSRKFGESGDFITAPETSNLFARCLARQCRQVLEEVGGGDVLEFGAGSGVLAADLLDELEALGSLPDRYLIVDVSPDLKARQKVLLQQRLPGVMNRIFWLDGFPAEGFRGLIIANEVLDAMPVHRFRVDQGRVQEQYVEVAGDQLKLNWGVASHVLQASVEHLLELSDGISVDYESELNLRAAPWLRALSERLAAGLILLIDYGYNRAEYYHPQRERGTLMCHYRHRAHQDPLFHPGLQDITAQVDFTGLAEAALEAGLAVCGYTTQAFFLMGCGLERLLADSDPEDVQRHLQLMQGAKRLTLPSEMGERFKVLGLSRGLRAQPIGFSVRDMRGRL